MKRYLIIFRGLLLLQLIIFLISPFFERTYSIEQTLSLALLTEHDLDEISKRHDEAISRNAIERIRKNPDDAEAYYSLGRVYLGSQMYNRALEAFKEAIRIKPYAADVQLELGDAYERLGAYKEAIEAYHQAIRIKPDDYLPWSGLKSANYDLERHDFETYRKLRELSEKAKQAINAIAYLRLGLIYSDLGRHDDALEAYKQLIQIDPDDWRVHFDLGGAYLKLKRYGEAVEAYKQAIKKSPDEALAHFDLAFAYGGLKRYMEAIEAYKQVIRLEPDNFEAHYNMGVNFGKLGRSHEAIEAYKQAIRIKPDYDYAHYNLGIEYLVLGRRGDALEQYKILKEIDKESTNTLFNLIYR